MSKQLCKPNLNDVGIIGQRIPEVNSELCKGCKKCAIEAACPNGVAKVVDGKITIDEMQCRHCGRCVGKCPFHTIADGIYGYKIYIGGRWGKKFLAENLSVKSSHPKKKR